MRTNDHISRYEEIACHIAKRIANGEFNENDKLRGRSVLSSEYNVSSETIRKAMQLLSNHNVVTVKEQSGVYVNKSIQAKHYVDYFEAHKKNRNLIHETKELLERSSKINHDLQKKFNQLEMTTKTASFPFSYFKLEVNKTASVINKTIASLDFYNQTKGLIIGIEEDGILNQLPEPNTIIKPMMVIYILGDADVKNKAIKLMNT